MFINPSIKTLQFRLSVISIKTLQVKTSTPNILRILSNYAF